MGLRVRAIALVALTVMVMAGCASGGGDSSGEPGLESVSVRLKWLHQSQFAGFYAALDKGLYEQAGLDVDLSPGGPDAPAVQLVASGSEQFGVAGADQILLAREKGVDVVALAVVYRQTPFVLMTRQDSGLESLTDLAGRKVGVKFGSSEEATYRAMLAASGAGQPDEVPVKFDLGPFLNGNLDAFPGYAINEALAADEAGVPVNLITPESLGLHLYADTLFTTGDMVREHPETVRGFVEATIEGWDWAVENPDDAAGLALEHDNTLKLSHEEAMMKASLTSIVPDDKPVGYMDEAGWDGLQDLLIEQGLMETAQDIADVFTTEFLPAS